MTCRHITDPMTSQCCAAGVNYLGLAGGGVYSMMLRLPCFELADRKGHEVARCTKRQVDKSSESHVDRIENLHQIANSGEPA